MTSMNSTLLYGGYNYEHCALPLLQELADLPCTSVQQKLNQYVSIILM